MKIKHNLKPIYNNYSQILILGSIPSITSREKEFYYAHLSNRFWPILANLFHEELRSKDDKINFLLKHHIALWDTIKSCEIINSSDNTIKNIEVNNINLLLKKAPIRAIFCLGNTSYKTFNKYLKVNIPVFYLPSPSSANASYNLTKLINIYKIILDYLN